MKKVLLVDDEVEMLNAVKRTLRKHFTVDVATGAESALALIKAEETYAVIVSDMQMPGMNGVELLRRVKLLSPDTVRIMLTGNADQKTAVDAVNQGDIFRFLNKPCAPEDLIASISLAIEHYVSSTTKQQQFVRAVSDAKTLSYELSRQSRYDKLTGIFNRTEFERQLDDTLLSTNKTKGIHTLCVVDIDRFNVINDSCSQPAGDAFLLQIVKILKDKVRKHDVLARMEGDGFSILLKDCPIDEARNIATRIRESVSAFRFLWESRYYSVTCSIGLLQIEDNSEDVRSLMHKGENLCVLAKNMGGDRVYVYQSDDHDLKQHRSLAQWATRVGQALDEDRFKLFFQRIIPVNMAYSEGDHYELLIRMIDDDGSVIPPGLFLPAAEKYHLAVKLDRWVIKTTFDWLIAHPEHIVNLRQCGVNLSGYSLGDEDMLAHICQTIDEHTGLATKICFEVTETAAIANLAKARNFIGELQERGCQFALDDFGSGLSSFAYLKNLPVNYLKIDGVFVRQIHSDHVDYAMVKSINDIAHVMGKETIAEFVENDQILSKLREIGVDYAQGYHINKPQPIDELLLVPEDNIRLAL